MDEKSAKAKRRRSRERQHVKESHIEDSSGEESYSSILHKLIHSKKQSLEASGRFPQVKSNSLLCTECSKSMLSYIAVLQDILGAVAGDITEKVSDHREEVLKQEVCPHCDEKSVSYNQQFKPNQQNSMSSNALGSSATEVHSNRGTFKNNEFPRQSSASSYFDSNVPQREIPHENPLRSCPPASHFSRHEIAQPSNVLQHDISPQNDTHSQSLVTNISQNVSKNLVGSTTGDRSLVSDIDKAEAEDLLKCLPDNLSVKDFIQEISDTGALTEVQNRLENLQPFGEGILTTKSLDKPHEISASKKSVVSEDSHISPAPVGHHNSGVTQGTEIFNRSLPIAATTTTCDFQYATDISLEPQGNIVHSESEEAYVTLATNNLSALLSLVLGYSLLTTKTSRSIIVLVTEGVCRELRYCLSTVFTAVQSVESLGTKEITKLCLLEDPELGISFVKLHIWQLKAFRKCVFLDSSTLVLKNCDELFKREELSAVPDIGWPDCFNSGVFVYAPSLETFWDLTDFLESQESYDGGDQGLLNMYFKNWASNISRKLPFIYNMMANVSYTYKPALKQFGSDVKIVHFFGPYKPWNVPFHFATGDLLPTADVHPTYVQFVKYWLDIFVGCVLPLFDEDVLSYCRAHKYTTVQELLQFFPSTPMLETFPIQPSFRLYPDSMIEERNESVTHNQPSLQEAESNDFNEKNKESVPSNEKSIEAVVSEGKSEAEELADQKSEEGENAMPGSEVGDYRGMEAWEQGKADYLGQDKSDTIMARLDFLMQDPSKT